MPQAIPRLVAAVRRYRRAREGATAVEFALVAAPFFMLLLGILELALVFLVSTTLEHATQEASRRIRTGEFQASGNVSAQDFENMVCSRLAWMGDACAAQLSVDSRAYASIPLMLAGQTANPYDPDDVCFEPGGPGQIVLVRTSIKWKVFTPLLRPAFGAANDGALYVRSTTAFKNEPFPGAAPGDACP